LWCEYTSPEPTLQELPSKWPELVLMEDYGKPNLLSSLAILTIIQV
jgi:hypothetical protein